MAVDLTERFVSWNLSFTLLDVRVAVYFVLHEALCYEN